jgi:hypothetical protein
MRGKHAKIAINKEQRFPAALHFNEFDVLKTNICLGPLRYVKFTGNIYIPYKILSAS